jgi:hypothetical protein
MDSSKTPGPVPIFACCASLCVMTDDTVETITKGYTFNEPSMELGVLMVDGSPVAEAKIQMPLSMLNRHGLIAGATGTGKTKTLQLLTEQISAAGVPVFAADIKGDLSGLATPGQSSDKLIARTQAIGQDWKPLASPVEFFALGAVIVQRTGTPWPWPTPAARHRRPARGSHVPGLRRRQARAQGPRRTRGLDRGSSVARAHRLLRPGR